MSNTADSTGDGVSDGVWLEGYEDAAIKGIG